jgi:hypothetical protein
MGHPAVKTIFGFGDREKQATTEADPCGMTKKANATATANAKTADPSTVLLTKCVSNFAHDDKGLAGELGAKTGSTAATKATAAVRV